MTLLEDLKNLSQEIHPYDASLARDLVSLENEARLLETRNAIPAQLRHDITNLMDGYRALLPAMQTGFEDDDILLTQQNFQALLLDIRKSLISHIKDWSAQMRVHSEISMRDKVDIEPIDLTAEYKMLTCRKESDSSLDEGFVIQSLPIPNKGGQPGRILGEILYTDQASNTPAYDNISPAGTIYLPKNHTMTLSKGDSLVLYHQGIRNGRKKMTLHDFTDFVSYRQIEALDDVVVHGPMTFTIAPQNDLTVLKSHLQDLENAFQKSPKLSKLFHIFGPVSATFNILLNLSFLIFSAKQLKVITENYTDGVEALIVLASFFPLVGISMACMSITMSLREKIQKGILNKILPSAYTKINPLQKRLLKSTEQEMKTKRSVKKVLNCFHAKNEMRVYPARKAIGTEGKGIDIMQPLMALPSPETEKIISFPSKTKIS